MVKFDVKVTTKNFLNCPQPQNTVHKTMIQKLKQQLHLKGKLRKQLNKHQNSQKTLLKADSKKITSSNSNNTVKN